MFEHIPTPLTIPKSPEYESTLFSSLTYDGGEIRTAGGLPAVYAIPGVVIVIDVTTPAVTDAVAYALAVVPTPARGVPPTPVGV